MTDKSIQNRKIVRLLDVFHFQHDFKYKFRPENLVTYLNNKEKQKHQKNRKYGEVKASDKNSKNKSRIKGNGIVNESNHKNFDINEENIIRDRLKQLEKQGLLSSHALPKVMEPTRIKCHWDYLIEEAEWLGVEFKSKLSWKILAAKLIAYEAQTYVRAKQEYKNLVNAKLQHEARLHCKLIARMIKDYWLQKVKELTLETEHSFIDSILDHVEDSTNYWFSKTMIQPSRSYDSLLDEEFFTYKSVTGSDSVCSFNSVNDDSTLINSSQDDSVVSDDVVLMQANTAGFYNDTEELNGLNVDEESSVYDFDLCDSDSVVIDKEGTSQQSELMQEVDWLVQDAHKVQLSTEITELVHLSQQPIDQIVDDQYFDIHKSIFDYSDDEHDESLSSIDSCIRDIDTTRKKASVSQVNVLGEVTETTDNAILSTITALNQIVNDQVPPNHADKDDQACTLVEVLDKAGLLLSRLYTANLPFILKSNKINSYERIALANHLSQLSSRNPCLITCSKLLLEEWQELLQKFQCPLLLLDNVNTQNDLQTLAHYLQQQQQHRTSSIVCLISYSSFCVSKQFLESTEWDVVIYDEFQNVMCSTVNSRYFVPALTTTHRRICVVENDDLFKPVYSHLFGQYLFSSGTWKAFLNDINYLDNGAVKKLFEQINEGLTVTLAVSQTTDIGAECTTVVCEATDIQRQLHTHVMDKLKSSLETRKLVDFVEAVTQGISISQHPCFFPRESYEDNAVYESLLPVSSHFKSFNDSRDSIVLKIESKTPSDKLIHCFQTITNRVPTSLQFADSSLFLDQFAGYLDPAYASRNFFSISDITDGINQEEGDGAPGADADSFLKADEIHDINNEFSDSCTQNPTSEIPTKSLPLLREPVSFRNTYYSYRRLLSPLCDDLNISNSQLDSLQRLCSLSSYQHQQVLSRTNPFKFINHNQIQKKFKHPPSDCIGGSLEKYLFLELKRQWQDSCLSNTLYDYSRCKMEIELSGKLQAFACLFHKALLDSSVRQVIILSHNFELLNTIEHFIKSSYTYDSRVSLLSLYSVEPRSQHLQNQVIDKFNLSSRSIVTSRKSVLLIHTRTNILNLYRLVPNSCSVITLDFHWSTDSRNVVSKLMCRWNANSHLSGFEPALAYNLCTFDTLEHFFVSNDLSFLYNNCYHDTTKNNPATVVCQQALLKYFVEHLNDPLKKYLISGFNIDDFHTNLEDSTQLSRVDTGSIDDVLLCFESARDAHLINYSAALAQFALCELQITEKASLHQHAGGVNNRSLCANHALQALDLQLDSVNIHDTHHEDDFYRDWEKIVTQRMQKLVDKNIFSTYSDLLFYEPDLLDAANPNTQIWGPPIFNPDAKFVPHEIQSNMYESTPMDLSHISVSTMKQYTYKNKKSAVTATVVNSINNESRQHSGSVTVPNNRYNHHHHHHNQQQQHREFESMGIKVEKQQHHHHGSGGGAGGSSNKKRKFSSHHQDGCVGDHASSFASGLQKKRKTAYQQADIDVNSTGTAIKTGGGYKYEKSQADPTKLSGQHYSSGVKDELFFEDSKDYHHHHSDNFMDLVPLDIKKTSSPQSGNINANTGSIHDPSDSNDEYGIVSNSTSVPKLSLQKPLYLMETNKSLKNKRQQQQMSHGGSSSNIKPGMSGASGGASSLHVTQHKLLLANKYQLALQKPSPASDYASQNDSELDKHGDWHLHEEAYFYQNVCHIQQCPLPNSSSSINTSYHADKSSSQQPFVPNLRVSEFYLNNYCTNVTYRSLDSCHSEFNRMHQGYMNVMVMSQNNITCSNNSSSSTVITGNVSGISGNLSGGSNNVSCSNTSGNVGGNPGGSGGGNIGSNNTGSSRTKNANIPAATSVSYLDSRSNVASSGGAGSELRQSSGRKMKPGKMKSSGALSGAANSALSNNSSSHNNNGLCGGGGGGQSSQQGHTNKMKLLHQISADLKTGLARSSPIIHSINNTSSISTAQVMKCVDDIVNKTRLSPPNHSQTIKKNATHTNALEEHNINPEKIFTPAMLIQRREEINREREQELSRQQQQHQQQIITSGGGGCQNFRSNTYESVGQMRRKQATVGINQRFYNIQQHQQVPPSSSVNMQRYPGGSRQLQQGSVLHHQQQQANTVSMANTIRASAMQYTTNNGTIVTGTGALTTGGSGLPNPHQSGAGSAGSIIMAHNPTVVGNQGVASVSIGTTGMGLSNRPGLSTGNMVGVGGGSNVSNQNTAYHFPLQQQHVASVTNQGRHIGGLGSAAAGQARTNQPTPRYVYASNMRQNSLVSNQPSVTHRAPFTTVSTTSSSMLSGGSISNMRSIALSTSSTASANQVNAAATASTFNNYQPQQQQQNSIRTYPMQHQQQQSQQQQQQQLRQQQVVGGVSTHRQSGGAARINTNSNITTLYTNTRVLQQHPQHYNQRNNE